MFHTFANNGGDEYEKRRHYPGILETRPSHSIEELLPFIAAPHASKD